MEANETLWDPLEVVEPHREHEWRSVFKIKCGIDSSLTASALRLVEDINVCHHLFLVIDSLIKEATERRGNQWHPVHSLDTIEGPRFCRLLCAFAAYTGTKFMQILQAKTSVLYHLSESVALRIHLAKSKVLRIIHLKEASEN